ncbi:tail fiber protein [Photorhabdus tasmaniensis]|uniref:tail fiber protein n=1 Tax=Photorhabdus tasmaniensis TaxID=1004159 RepID=UPI0010D3AB15|nr:tail fiber protein [Photorhabdus tasmaniensis]
MARNAVPGSRKINGKALSGDVNISSQDIFGEPTLILDRADLNDYETPGLYVQYANANARTGKNYPEQLAGSLVVLKNNAVTQRYFVYNSSRVYTRSQYLNSPWTPWAQEYNSENPQPPNIPVGIPLPYPHRYTPPGYLTCNGQTFNKSLYPKLAEAYPDGKIPDLRGEFIRGWDDGRGVDPGRVCGSWQTDEFKSHSHSITFRTVLRYENEGGTTLNNENLGSYQSFTTEKTGGHETRPRNVAFNYIVRAA